MLSRFDTSGSSLNYLYLLCAMPLMITVLWEDPRVADQEFIDTMTAATVEDALETGLDEELAPYFNHCQDINTMSAAPEGVIFPEGETETNYAEIAFAERMRACLMSQRDMAERPSVPARLFQP